MYPANRTTLRRSILKSVPALILSVAVSATVAAAAALRNVLTGLLCRFLIHLAAGPYPASELYDPSEEYELAHEVLVMERLITGGLGLVVGLARVIRLFGADRQVLGLLDPGHFDHHLAQAEAVFCHLAESSHNLARVRAVRDRAAFSLEVMESRLQGLE